LEKDWLDSAKIAPACGTPDCPVVHQTVSGALGWLGGELAALGNRLGDVAKNHWTVR
jgi:hypothetical protein